MAEAKKALVLVRGYPDTSGGLSMMYVHVRNKYYIEHGIDVTVLSFTAKQDYNIDGIRVITKSTYRKEARDYDVLICHAANIRNHYVFLVQYADRFEKIIFFFHGHEVLMTTEVYPKPYDYTKKDSPIILFAKNTYDRYKLSVWHRYYPKIAYKAQFVFVSNWLYGEFQKYVGLTDADLQGHVHIINNSVGKVFEENTYRYEGDKQYDFITIRSNMDNSKYGVDLVDGLARKYPEYSFLVIGRGQYYRIHDVPSNVTWVDRFLSHEEIMDFINMSRCGILLTREDTQGVMTCELAEYGIPVITSDIEVCQEICRDLTNVKLIPNDVSQVDLKQIYEELIDGVPYKKQGLYSYANTVEREEQLIDSESPAGKGFQNIGGGFDFVTIRSNLDSSVYCIDIVAALARKYPRYRFLVIGKGRYFEYHEKPTNITLLTEYMSHSQMLKFINRSRCALMPTRRDTQGVMSCELVTYGIPLITSDLPICHEMFDEVESVEFIGYDVKRVVLETIYEKVTKKSSSEKCRKFLYENTVRVEEEMVREQVIDRA